MSGFSGGGAGAAPGVTNLPYGRPVNLMISVTKAANALTIALKCADGTTPTVLNKVLIPYATTSGATTYPFWSAIVAANSITIPSGTTIGTSSALLSPIYLYGINNAGATELAVSTNWFGDTGVVTTAAISGGATATTMYSTTARTSFQFTLLGVVYSTQTTAGTWAADPSLIELAPFKLKGYKFRADLNGSNQAGFASSTFTKANLDHIVYDDNSAYDATNKKFICQEPGKYFFVADLGSSAGYSTMVYIRKNGIATLTGLQSIASGLGPAGVSGWVDLVPGDYIEIYGYQNTGSDSIYGSASFTWLAGSIDR